MRTLFVGCSHTMGYCNTNLNQPVNVWQKNNYAEIYSKIHNKKCVIMASAGTGNRAYPRFLAHAFNTYDDIDEVFLQSTYWGRFPVVINPDLDYKKIFPIDFFLQKDLSSDLIDRWSISLSVKNKYLEHFIKAQPEDWSMFPYIRDTAPWIAEPDPRRSSYLYFQMWHYQNTHLEHFVKARPEDWSMFPYIRDTAPWIAEPDPRRSSYLYFQMWHYQNTHLEQEDYMKDIAVCDMICANNNVPMYVWNINNKCFIPKETLNFFTKLSKTHIAKFDCETYLESIGYKNIKKEKVDDEHYNYRAHELIAEKYIPYIREIHDRQL